MRKPIKVKAVDNTVKRVGSRFPKTYRATWSTVPIYPYTTVVGGTDNATTVATPTVNEGNGAAFVSDGTKTVWFAGNMHFDPMGQVQKTPSGLQTGSDVIATIPAPTVKYLTPSKFFKELIDYAFYKVDRITITWTARDLGDLNHGSPELYIRQNTDAVYETLSPISYDFSTQNGWLHKKFTDEFPTFKFSFRPHVSTLDMYGNGFNFTTSAMSRYASVGVAIPLFGVQYMVCMPQGANCRVDCDYSYRISLKERK